MPRLTDEQRQDLELLTSLIAAISRLLAWITTESRMVPRELQEQSYVVLQIVQRRLRTSIDSVREVSDTDEEIWTRLDQAGLVGAPLRLKAAIWERVATPPQRPRAVGSRILRPLLSMVNSLLGSLAKVFAPLELAKEYKEGIEVVIEHQRRPQDPPEGILNLR